MTSIVLDAVTALRLERYFSSPLRINAQMRGYFDKKANTFHGNDLVFLPAEGALTETEVKELDLVPCVIGRGVSREDLFKLDTLVSHFREGEDAIINHNYVAIYPSIAARPHLGLACVRFTAEFIAAVRAAVRGANTAANTRTAVENVLCQRNPVTIWEPVTITLANDEITRISLAACAGELPAIEAQAALVEELRAYAAAAARPRPADANVTRALGDAAAADSRRLLIEAGKTQIALLDRLME